MLCAKFGLNWKTAWPFIWTNLSPHHPFGCFVPSMVGIGPVVLEKIFKIVVLSLFFMFSLKILWPCMWTQLHPHHPNMVCAKFGWNWPSGWEEDFYKCRIFTFFFIISPWVSLWPFIWTNLYPHHPRMLWAKFGWKWPSGSWEEEKNVKSSQTDGRTTGDQKSSLELSAQVK